MVVGATRRSGSHNLHFLLNCHAIFERGDVFEEAFSHLIEPHRRRWVDRLHVLSAFNPRRSPRDCAHEHHYARLNDAYLLGKVGCAGFDFVCERPPVPWTRVLHEVRHEEVFAVDAVCRQGFVKEFARSAHEGSARFVFFSAWVLSDKHHACSFGSFARHRVLGALPESASSAVPYLLVQLL